MGSSAFLDFRNLNEACLKDDFPLPVTELMIDQPWDMKPYPLWIALQGIIKSR